MGLLHRGVARNSCQSVESGSRFHHSLHAGIPQELQERGKDFKIRCSAQCGFKRFKKERVSASILLGGLCARWQSYLIAKTPGILPAFWTQAEAVKFLPQRTRSTQRKKNSPLNSAFSAFSAVNFSTGSASCLHSGASEESGFRRYTEDTDGRAANKITGSFRLLRFSRRTTGGYRTYSHRKAYAGSVANRFWKIALLSACSANIARDHARYFSSDCVDEGSNGPADAARNCKCNIA